MLMFGRGRQSKCIYDTCWGRVIRLCLYQKFEKDTWWTRLRRSWSKLLLEIALWPIHNELRRNQDYLSAYLEEDAVVHFFFGKSPIHIYVPDYKTDVLQNDISTMHTFFELDLLQYVKKQYLHDGMNYFDCGANIGNHTLFFACVSNAYTVFSFEGNPKTFEILEKNIELNGLENRVKLFNYVLGEHKGRAKIAHEEVDNLGATSFCEDVAGNAEMICIDDMSWEQKIDFIKMDVEGFECYVLKGMKSLLQRDKPILWVEIFPENYQRVLALLGEFGYCQKEALAGCNYIFVSGNVD